MTAGLHEGLLTEIRGPSTRVMKTIRTIGWMWANLVPLQTDNVLQKCRLRMCSEYERLRHGKKLLNNGRFLAPIVVTSDVAVIAPMNFVMPGRLERTAAMVHMRAPT